ncbi:MAG: hypothetical protein JXQ75_03170 [Phycisphaerae bacterium]|nr:hypothetical protein [Phycisphaerae bacterium]
MRIPLYFAASDGTPATGLTPTFVALRTAVSKTDRLAEAPALEEIGGGWYAFDWDLADTDEDLLGTVDGGAALAEANRYQPAPITHFLKALLVMAGKVDLPRGTLDTLPGAVRQGAWM